MREAQSFGGRVHPYGMQVLWGVRRFYRAMHPYGMRRCPSRSPHPSLRGRSPKHVIARAKPEAIHGEREKIVISG